MSRNPVLAAKLDKPLLLLKHPEVDGSLVSLRVLPRRLRPTTAVLLAGYLVAEELHGTRQMGARRPPLGPKCEGSPHGLSDLSQVGPGTLPAFQEAGSCSSHPFRMRACPSSYPHIHTLSL